ncbi:MAG: phytase, partial [Gammaproteobacteria bacterium]|nr:phytase [Gammaproteobacteria bacterium]
MRIIAAMFAASVLLWGCQPPPSSPPRDDTPATASLFAAAETTVTLTDGANDPAILIDADDPANSLILGAGLAGGLEVYDLDGLRIAVMPDRPIGLVDVRYNFSLAGEDIPLIVAYDAVTTELVAYRMDESGRTLRQISSHPLLTEMDVGGLCTYRSPLTGKFYAFAAGAGTIQQWELYDSEGSVAGRKIRTIPVGHGAGHCAVDDRESTIYYSQETVGIWKLDADPESEGEPELIDLGGRHGRFEGDVKGVAIVESLAGGGYLVVSDADVDRLHVYDLASQVHMGAFSVDAGASIGAVDETEGMAATGMALSGEFGNGLLVLTDDDNDGQHTNYKILPWSYVVTALDLPGGAGRDPTARAAPATAVVHPSVETDPVASYGDAADDAAIWVHPDNPELSIVIGSQKKRGINVYD